MRCIWCGDDNAPFNVGDPTTDTIIGDVCEKHIYQVIDEMEVGNRIVIIKTGNGED